MLNLFDFDYTLPNDLIAQAPVTPRDHCKLMIVDRTAHTISHRHFYDLKDLLTPHDVLVLNQSKVMPARLYGQKPTGGQVELLLLKQLGPDRWETISKPGLKVGQLVLFALPEGQARSSRGGYKTKDSLAATVIATHLHTATLELQFNQSGPPLLETLYALGRTPIPPYIHTQLTEAVLRREYQTVFARDLGSAAAPTAGMHFTQELLDELKQKGIQIEYVTLHVGQGTFQNLRPENLETKTLHGEWYEITLETAERINLAKKQGKRIIAVGTTAARTLESAWEIKNKTLSARTDTTQLFIYPPYQFQVADHLITNFHLPQSSLLMLVSSLASSPHTSSPFITFSQSLMGQAYQEAINHRYRFYSFGDAMWIV